MKQSTNMGTKGTLVGRVVYGGLSLLSFKSLKLGLFLVFSFIGLSNYASAQLTSGSVVVISVDDNYMATNTESIYSVSSLTSQYDNALWRVSRTSNNYTFQNLTTGKFLGYSKSGNVFTLIISDNSVNWKLERNQL